MSWRVIWIPELLGAVLGGIFVFRLGMGTMPKTVLHACEEFTGMLRESRRYENWVTGTEKKLRKNGAKFHYGKKITPVKYLLMRLFLSLGAVLTLESIGWGYALLAAMGLYYVPELLLLYLNRQDNRKMMPDLQLIYQALEVQTCAGVYVTDALTECCQSVRTQRLQQALMELSGDLVIQSDLVTALSDFQQKFDNRQIDALCITLIQAGESGQAVDLLKDMGEQLKDMELTVLQQQKSALDRSITFYQLGMLVVFDCVRSQRRINARQGEIRLLMDGRLRWQGQEWSIVKAPWMIKSGMMLRLRSDSGKRQHLWLAADSMDEAEWRDLRRILLQQETQR